jgi:hypothetical protein
VGSERPGIQHAQLVPLHSVLPHLQVEAPVALHARPSSVRCAQQGLNLAGRD